MGRKRKVRTAGFKAMAAAKAERHNELLALEAERDAVGRH